jgi:hypothetical protein
MPALKTTAARARGPSAGAPCGRVNDNARATAAVPEDGVQCKTGPSGPLKLTRVLLVCREARPPVTEHGGPPGGGTWSGASASFPSAASQPGSDASVARRRLALVEGASGAGRRAPLSNQSTPRRAAATGRPSRLALDKAARRRPACLRSLHHGAGAPASAVLFRETRRPSVQPNPSPSKLAASARTCAGPNKCGAAFHRGRAPPPRQPAG